MERCQEAGCPAVWEDNWELSKNGRLNAVCLVCACVYMHHYMCLSQLFLMQHLNISTIMSNFNGTVSDTTQTCVWSVKV